MNTALVKRQPVSPLFSKNHADEYHGWTGMDTDKCEHDTDQALCLQVVFERRNPVRDSYPCLSVFIRGKRSIPLHRSYALKWLALAGFLLAATLHRAASQTAVDEDSPWPRVRSTNGNTVTLYLPQVERWTSNWFNARGAVEVKLAHSKKDLVGVIWLEAHGSVDRTNRLVSLDRFDITRARFPDATDGGSNALAAVREVLPSGARTVSLDYLITSLGFAQVAARRANGGFNDNPPEIFWVTNRTVLVLIDGEPVLRPSGIESVERVINTPALLLRDTASSKFYLSGQDQWFAAPAFDGPWSLAQQVPSPIAALAPAPTNAPPSPALEPAPRILVCTHPAELLATDGLPQYQPVRGTKLQYAADTDALLFFHTSRREAYLLLAGRWFKSSSLNGPWTRVPLGDLPEDFARIPPGSPQAVVLASVPDTPQAELALLASSVPTTATVNRHEAKIQISYDGEPKFKPIEGTSMSYALNAQLPVIRSGDKYYAVDNGVWFVAPEATGPWEVAVEVPEEIYTIPPSSPVYYATYARIYQADDDEVEAGYTPGYEGAYEEDGTVVYGTGYDYEPWCDHDYYGWGWTWGYSYIYVPWYQWWAWRPWWRPAHGLWAALIGNIYDRWQDRPGVTPHERLDAGRANRDSWRGYSGYPALYGRFQGTARTQAMPAPPNTLALNPYTRPQKPVQRGEVPRGAQLLSSVRESPGRGRDLYASPDGNVYLRKPDGWYSRQPGGKWRLAAPLTSSGVDRSGGVGGVNRPAPGPQRRSTRAGYVPNAGVDVGARDVAALERQYYARNLSQMRAQNYRPPVNRGGGGRVNRGGVRRR